jgi:hypothetical protein
LKLSSPTKAIPKLADIPFNTWREGIDLDQKFLFERSSLKFGRAAEEFYDLAFKQPEVARAYNEYSVLMDAYSKIQEGRAEIKRNEFAIALKRFEDGANILRSTFHFGFLAPFVSACATTETADKMESDDPERMQAYKNAIALFEQSKLALSFRDERHFIVNIIDAYIRYCISKALSLEAILEKGLGHLHEAREKEKRSKLLEREFEGFLRKAHVTEERFQFLPLDDYRRVAEGAFVASFPDKSNLWIFNLGNNAAIIEKVGMYDPVGVSIEPRSSMKLDPKLVGKGKIRIRYKDKVFGKEYDEGCLMAV